MPNNLTYLSGLPKAIFLFWLVPKVHWCDIPRSHRLCLTNCVWHEYSQMPVWPMKGSSHEMQGMRVQTMLNGYSSFSWSIIYYIADWVHSSYTFCLECRVKNCNNLSIWTYVVANCKEWWEWEDISWFQGPYYRAVRRRFQAWVQLEGSSCKALPHTSYRPVEPPWTPWWMQHLHTTTPTCAKSNCETIQ